ncbi:hypothetical protein Peur_047798 [Populus x canadensis]
MLNGRSFSCLTCYSSSPLGIFLRFLLFCLPQFFQLDNSNFVPFLFCFQKLQIPKIIVHNCFCILITILNLTR